MNLCTIAKEDSFEQWKDEINWLNSIGYGDLNYDALWKWSGILNAIKSLGIEKFETCIDAGGGLSPIHYKLSEMGKVINVDILFEQNWFPTRNNVYINSHLENFYGENPQLIQQDFLSYMQSIPDDSIDLIIDGCSIIHFDTNHSLHPLIRNDGCFRAGKIIHQKLRSNGYFIVTSDTLHPWCKEFVSLNNNYGEMLYWENTVDLYERCGFELVEKFDDDMGDFLMNKDNWFKESENVPKSEYHRRITPKFSSKDIHPSHCFCQDRGGWGLTLSRYVFRKKV